MRIDLVPKSMHMASFSWIYTHPIWNSVTHHWIESLNPRFNDCFHDLMIDLYPALTWWLSLSNMRTISSLSIILLYTYVIWHESWINKIKGRGIKIKLSGSEHSIPKPDVLYSGEWRFLSCLHINILIGAYSWKPWSLVIMSKTRNLSVHDWDSSVWGNWIFVLLFFLLISIISYAIAKLL